MVGKKVKIANIDNSFNKLRVEGEERDRVVAGGAMDLTFQLIFSYNKKNVDFGIRHIWISVSPLPDVRSGAHCLGHSRLPINVY